MCALKVCGWNGEWSTLETKNNFLQYYYYVIYFFTLIYNIWTFRRLSEMWYHNGQNSEIWESSCFRIHSTLKRLANNVKINTFFKFGISYFKIYPDFYIYTTHLYFSTEFHLVAQESIIKHIIRDPQEFENFCYEQIGIIVLNLVNSPSIKIL